MVVTATFGMVTAGQVLRRLAEAAAAAKAAEAALEASAVPAGQTVQAEAALLS